MGHLLLPCDTSQVSDGYHTFDELYNHRNLLFIAAMKTYPQLSWRARFHHDGTGEAGWWIGGMHLPTGDISYHLPDRFWQLLDAVTIETRERAPKWDGHTASEVLDRLRRWIED